MRRKIERVLFKKDRLPRQVASDRFIHILQARLVHCEEQERVAVKAWAVAARFEDRLRHNFGGVVGLLAVRMVDGEHDQPRVEVVRNVLSRLWHRMDPAEVARPAQVDPKALFMTLYHS